MEKDEGSKKKVKVQGVEFKGITRQKLNMLIIVLFHQC